MYNKMSFGENLINLRRQKGWSQDDLANNLNISRQAISKWETDISKPDVDNLERISKIFSVTIDNLLDNDLPNDKAVALDVKKKEKKEKTITIVKLMIIAVIILYAISVIYKFASLLVIVNGVQKYANLNNYHYVITTYDENGLVEKEECWFKDGVSKTVNEKFQKNEILENFCTFIDFNKREGYVEDNLMNTKVDINFESYIITHNGYENGKQLYSKFPIEIRAGNIKNTLLEIVFDEVNIDMTENIFNIKTKDNNIFLDDKTLIPVSSFSVKEGKPQILNIFYFVELNTVQSI